MTSIPARELDPAAVSSAAAPVRAARSPNTDGWPLALREAQRPPGAASGTEPVNWIRGTPQTVSLLDVEPGLGRGIAPRDWEVARQATRTTLARVGRREFVLPVGACDTANVVGLIVNDGLISREIALGDHVAFELLTPGDVLLPPAAEAGDLDLGSGVTLTALNPAKLIVLNTTFIHAAARWPSLLTGLHRRLEAQRRRLAIQSLAAHLPRAEDRLLLTLWILADSCGRVTPEGTVLPLSLSHEVLGRLAASRRPTITLALRSLEGAECIQRRRDGHLALRSAAQRRVQALTQASLGHSPIGPRVALHQVPPTNGATATNRPEPLVGAHEPNRNAASGSAQTSATKPLGAL